MRKKWICLMLCLSVIVSGYSVTFAADTTEGTVQTPESVISTGTEEPSADAPAEAEPADSARDGEASQEMLFFTDVQNPAAYYYEPVYWAVQKGITEGTSPTEFSPEASCTRAQIITFFWRAAGSPEPRSEENPFQDVNPGAYYRDAVLWAVEQGLTQGLTEDSFAPDQVCTRSQCVTFLWRYQGSLNDGFHVNFQDVPENAYYVVPVSWAVRNGITNGFPQSGFAPEQDCNRAQAMTFFYRSMMEAVENTELPEQDRAAGSFRTPETDGKTGELRLKADSVSVPGLFDVKDVQAVLWTSEDQSDLRWFSMQSAGDGADGIYATTQNVETFHRFFGTYHASLYLVRHTGEQLQRIHLDDCTFEVAPQNYMYSEPLGMGRIRVSLQGVAPEITSLQIVAWDRSNGSGASHVYDAVASEEKVWSAEIDLLETMNRGTCGLTAVVPETGEELNIITENVNVKKVIDVSQYQGDINWSVAKESGMFEAVIIRCGLRNYRGKCVRDTKFTYNAQSCEALGIPMGFYWFTSALSVQEAYAEADYCAALLQPYHLEYPIFIDTEWGSRSGLNGMSGNKRSECVLAFLERMEAYGYQTGIYASSDWMWGYMDYEPVASERLWVASWNGRPYYPDQYMAWQYTAKARIPGITQNTTDVSYWFE